MFEVKKVVHLSSCTIGNLLTGESVRVLKRELIADKSMLKLNN